jgi:hypothetical protein
VAFGATEVEAAFASAEVTTKPIEARDSISPSSFFISFPSKNNKPDCSTSPGEPDLVYKTLGSGKELHFLPQNSYFVREITIFIVGSEGLWDRKAV